MKKIALSCVFVVSMMNLAVAEVVVESPWVREGPPNAKTLAAYMVLRNDDDSAEILKGATASGFEGVEIHRTVMEEGVATMVPQESLTIPSKGSVTLAPGGLHLMLINGKKPVKTGDSVELTLRFSDGETIDVDAPVRTSPASAGHASH